MFTTVINKIQENAVVKFIVGILSTIVGSMFLSGVVGQFSSKAGILVSILCVIGGFWVSCAIFCINGRKNF